MFAVIWLPLFESKTGSITLAISSLNKNKEVRILSLCDQYKNRGKMKICLMYISLCVFHFSSSDSSTLENLWVNTVFGTIQQKSEKDVDCMLFKKVIGFIKMIKVS